MIYLFCGNNFRSTRKNLRAFLDGLFIKKPTAAFIELDDESFTKSRLEELMASKGLFENETIVVLDSVFGNDAARDFLKDSMAELSQSSSVFIFFERELDARILKLFERYARRVWRSDKGEVVRKKEFNVFALTDALGKRDRKKAWALLQEAYQRGTPTENIHGILLWRIKSIIFVKDAESQGQRALSQLKLNPFVLKKARSFSREFTRHELIQLSGRLVGMYHEARRGGEELDIGIEKLILSI